MISYSVHCVVADSRLTTTIRTDQVKFQSTVDVFMLQRAYSPTARLAVESKRLARSVTESQGRKGDAAWVHQLELSILHVMLLMLKEVRSEEEPNAGTEESHDRF